MANMNPWYEMFAKGMVDPRQAALLEAQNASQEEDPTGTIGMLPQVREPAAISAGAPLASRTQQVQEFKQTAEDLGPAMSPSSELEQRGTSQSVTPSVMDEVEMERYKAVRGDVENRPQNVKDRASIDSQEQFLQKYMKTPIGFDFKTAMGGLASFYPDSSAANLYKILPANDTTETRAKTIKLLQDSLNKSRSGYYKSVEDQMKPFVSGAVIKNTVDEKLKNTLARTPPAKPDTYGKRNDDINFRAFMTKLEDKTKKYDEPYTVLEEIMQLDPNSTITPQRIQALMNRGVNMEKGASSEGDIQRAKISRAIVDSLTSYINLAGEGTVDKAQLKTLKKYAATQSGLLNKQLGAQLRA